jgi:ADP-ribose pyrophosphatase YjhB (NUDIX family)
MTFKRAYADHPIVAIGGVVIETGRVLLVQRGGEPSAGTWSIPGGVLERGETLRQGVMRELLEESGLEVEVLQLIDVAERILPPPGGQTGTQNPVAPEYHYVILDYLCAVKSGIARAGSDAAEVAWVSEQDLARFDLHAEVMRILRRAFEIVRRT